MAPGGVARWIAGIDAPRDRVGSRPDGGLRGVSRRRALEPLLGRRELARLGVARRRARSRRWRGRLVVVGGSARCVGARARWPDLASLVGWRPLGGVGAARR